MSEQKVNLKPYKYTVNGIQYFDVTPDYNVSNQYTPASVEELQGEIGRYQGKTDDWSQNYLRSLQSGLSKIQSGTSPYVLNEQGVLATQQEVAAQKAQRGAMVAGREVAVGGTFDAPLTVPKGTPFPATATYSQSLAGPAGQIPGVAPVDPNAISKRYEEAFNTQKQQRYETPTDAVGAKTMFDTFLQDQSASSVANTFVSQDSYLQTTIANYQNYMSQQSQRTSLVEEYKKLLKTSGIEAIDMKLINIQNVMDGNEDMIRTEITAANGIATEGQVLALTDARNRQLIKNYKNLTATRNSKRQYIDTVMNLSQQDRAEADRLFDTQMNFGFKIAEINQQMKQNAISTIDRVAQTLGWDGVWNATQGNPQMIAQIERTYGLPTGGLRIAAQQAFEARQAAEYERGLGIQEKQLGMQLKEQQLRFGEEDRPLELQERKMGLSLKTEQIKTEKAQRDKIIADTKKITEELKPKQSPYRIETNQRIIQ